jgi:hypothetical protein
MARKKSNPQVRSPIHATARSDSRTSVTLTRNPETERRQLLMNQVNVISILAAVTAFSIAIGLLLFRSRFAWLGFALALFFASLGIALDYRKQLWEQWLLPLQAGRALELAASCIGLFLGAKAALRHPAIRPGMPVITIIVLGLGLGLVRLLHGDPVDALLSFIFTAISGVSVATYSRRMTTTTRNVDWLAESIAAVLLACTICSIVQHLVNPSKLVIGLDSRLIGVSGNPQFVGVLCACSGLCLVWLIGRRQGPMRLACIALLIAALVGILWSGSRTSLMMLAVGLFVMFIRRLGVMSIALPLVAVAFLFTRWIADALAIELPLERLWSSENTRREAWGRLIQAFLRNPFVGSGAEELDASENSFLYAAASFGIVGLVLLVSSVVATLAICFRAVRLYTQMNLLQHKSVNLILGLVAMILFGSVFEGYLVGRVGAMPLLWLAAIASLEILVAETEAEAREPIDEEAERDVLSPDS